MNSDTQHIQTCLELFTVQFRTLSTEQIERYLKAEQPYDCAGSFKVEGLGITLFEKLIGDDPNSLIGLPLIRLVDLLSKEGIALP
jgi:predicted house-cleaning NTP pyrophosphatase (Maf/HAM1 superfamily)